MHCISVVVDLSVGVDNPNAMKLAVPLIKITNENQEETSDPE